MKVMYAVHCYFMYQQGPVTGATEHKTLPWFRNPCVQTIDIETVFISMVQTDSR